MDSNKFDLGLLVDCAFSVALFFASIGLLSILVSCVSGEYVEYVKKRPPVLTLSRQYATPSNLFTLSQSLYDNVTTRTSDFMSSSRQSITDGNMPGGKYFIACGSGTGGYTSFFAPRDWHWMLEGWHESISATDMRSALDWMIYYQIKDNTTTHAPWYSGGSNIYYPKGAMFDYCQAAGGATVQFHAGSDALPVGDQPPIDDSLHFVMAAYYYGHKLGWNAEWQTFWTTYKDNLQWAYDAAPKNGTTHMVKQYDLSAGFAGAATGGITVDNCRPTGDLLGDTILAHNAALVMAEFYYRSTGADATQANIDTWMTRADQHRDAVRASFVTVADPVWDYYKETFDMYPTGSGLEGWSTGTANGTVSVVVDNADSSSKLLRLHNESGVAAGPYVQHRWSVPQYEVAADCVAVRAKTMQTDTVCDMILLGDLDHDGTKGFLRITFGDDGHIKYDNAALARTNLPTDTTYSADTWYELRLALDWTNKQATVFIDNVSKGVIPFQTSSVSYIDFIQIQAGAAATPPTNAATSFYDYVRYWKTPDNTVDTATCGYLPVSTDDRMMSPEATGQACYYNVLTSTQQTQAGRYLNLLWQQPKATNVGTNDDRDLFHHNAAWKGYTRLVRWAEDARHGTRAWNFTYWTATYGGAHQNGGYWPNSIGWISYAMSLHNADLALELATGYAQSITTGGTSHPYEVVGSGLAAANERQNFSLSPMLPILVDPSP